MATVSSLVATPDTTRSLVRLDTDFSDVMVQPDGYTILRTRLDTGARALVRQSPAALPITAVYQQINSNADFELGIANWTAITTSGPVPTLSQDTGAGHFNRGSAGMNLVISTSINSNAGVESEKCPVIPGQIYAVTGWAATATYAALPGIGINWYDANNNKIGTTLGPAQNVNPGAALVLQPTFGQPASTNGYGWIAPPGAATATFVWQFNPQEKWTQATAYTFYLDELRLLQLVSIVSGTTTPAVPTSATDPTVPTVVNRLVSGQAVAYDHEMPLDTQLSYTATAYVINGSWAIMVGGQQLEGNPLFESPQNTTNWAALAGTTLAASTTQAHQGVQSLRLTSDGVTANTGTNGEFIPATPGLVYAYSMQIWMTTGAAMQMGVTWDQQLSSGVGFGGQSVQTTTPATGAWTRVAGYGTAIATALGAHLVAKFSGTAAAANLVYLDEMYLYSPASIPATAASGTVTVASNGLIWLKDPLAPANSLPITASRRVYGGWQFNMSAQGIGFLGFKDDVRKAMAGTMDVNNRPDMLVQARIRANPSTTLMLAAHSFADRDNLRAALTPGSPLLLQMPPVFGQPDRYLQFGDETAAVLGQDQRKQHRIFTLPCTVVSAPAGAAQAPQGYRWRDAGRAYPTWGAVLASGGGVYDSFRTRSIVLGNPWGTPDVGPANWTAPSSQADQQVIAGQGALFKMSVVGNLDAAIIPGSWLNVTRAAVTITPSVVALGNQYRAGLALRWIGVNDAYWLMAEFGLTGALTIRIMRNTTAGGLVTLASSGALTYTVGVPVRVSAAISGGATPTITMWAWNPLTGAEPATATVGPFTDTTPGTLNVAGGAGALAQLGGGNTNTLPVLITFNDFVVATGPTWQQIADGALA